MFRTLLLVLALLLAYARHAVTVPHPLLHLGLLRIRTLRTAILGSFITRIGVGGMPFLLPLLYQVGLGYSAVQSGLLIVPQSVAAISLRMFMPRLLRRFGYRRVLLGNTTAVGLAIMSFSLVGARTAPAVIAALAFCFGFFASLQYTSMNTLVYADVSDAQTSMASTMASTMQQLSMSFGVAAASLATAVFIPHRMHAVVQLDDAHNIVSGIHKACIAMGLFTIGSTLLFRQLRREDGANVSRHKAALPAT